MTTSRKRKTTEAGDGTTPKPKSARRSPKPRKPTGLQLFRAQTLAQKKKLQAEKKRIDKELRLIIKDLGKLKKTPKVAAA